MEMRENQQKSAAKPTHSVLFQLNPDTKKSRYIEIGKGWEKANGVSVVIDRLPYNGLPPGEELPLFIKMIV